MGEEVGLKTYFFDMFGSFCMLWGTFRELLRDVKDRSGLLP